MHTIGRNVDLFNFWFKRPPNAFVVVNIMTTRKSDKALFILTESPGIENLNLSGTKLPTNKQVILCFLANLNDLRSRDGSKNLSLRCEVANILTEQIITIYAKAGTPVLGKSAVRKKLFDLHNKYLNVKKHIGRKMEEFHAYLQLTAEFWPKNALQIMEASKKGKCKAEKDAIDQDINFLIDMQNGRKQTFGSIDSTAAKSSAIRRQRQEKDLSRKIQHLDRAQDDFVFDPVEAVPGSDEEFSDGEGGGAPAKRRRHRSTKTGVTITITRDILKDPEMLSMCVRNHISPTAMSAMLHTLVKVSGGDPNLLSLSTSTALR